MTEKLTDEALEKMAGLYDQRVAQHDGLKDLLCGQLRSERGQQTRDLHAATSVAIRELLERRRSTPADDLREAALGMKRIVEEIDGSMKHGTWRDDKGNRLKDTPEWVALYVALAALAQKGDA